MIDRITELLNELEQEINDGYNTLPDYQTNDEGKTYINGAQATLYELQKQITELEQGLRQGKTSHYLERSQIMAKDANRFWVNACIEIYVPDQGLVKKLQKMKN